MDPLGGSGEEEQEKEEVSIGPACSPTAKRSMIADKEGSSKSPKLSPRPTSPLSPPNVPALGSARMTTAAAAAAPAAQQPAAPDVPIHRLENHFNEMMLNQNVPLLSSWESYKQMLPLRETRRQERIIAECPYWAKPVEVTHLAVAMESAEDAERVALPYLSAPTHSGKTASILVGFLDSCESNRNDRFTHYFYLAFNNNRDKHFRYGERPGDEKALSKAARENQGARFAFLCLEFLLTKGPLTKQQIFNREGEPDRLPTPGETTTRIDEMLTKMIPGDERRILFHVDEHRKMNTDDEIFRRGALEALARCKRAVCVVTYTEIPTEIAAEGSSEVCRRPVIKPMLDMTEVFNNIPELNILNLLQEPQRRAWATLVFKLAWHIRPMMLQFHMGMQTKFLEDFDKQRKAKNIGECLKLCYRNPQMHTMVRSGITELMVGIKDDGITELMVGIKDDELPNIKYKLPPLTVANDRITATLESFLGAHDADHEIYNEAHDRFVRAVIEAKPENDMLSATPLEAAFGWSLSCIAATKGSLKFSTYTFKLTPTGLRTGRLFPGSDQQVTNVSGLEDSVLYIVDEKKRVNEPPKNSHPLCDIFFLTKNKELVLIDVTGGVKGSQEKFDNLKNWIQSPAAKKLQQYRKFGIVVAPADESETQSMDIRLAPPDGGNTADDFLNGVCAVRGKEAREFLGGLAQCWEWFV